MRKIYVIPTLKLKKESESKLVLCTYVGARVFGSIFCAFSIFWMVIWIKQEGLTSSSQIKENIHGTLGIIIGLACFFIGLYLLGTYRRIVFNKITQKIIFYRYLFGFFIRKRFFDFRDINEVNLQHEYCVDKDGYGAHHFYIYLKTNDGESYNLGEYPSLSQFHYIANSASNMLNCNLNDEATEEYKDKLEELKKRPWWKKIKITWHWGSK